MKDFEWTIKDPETGEVEEVVKPCDQWFTDYTLGNSLGILLSLSLTLINDILRRLIKACSKFEGHHTVTNQLGSAFSKMWIIQFINTAVILLIINMRLSEGFIQWVLEQIGLENIFFDGDFVDFNTEWY